MQQIRILNRSVVMVIRGTWVIQILDSYDRQAACCPIRWFERTTVEQFGYVSNSYPFPCIWYVKWRLIGDTHRFRIADFLIRSIIGTDCWHLFMQVFSFCLLPISLFSVTPP